MRVCVSVCRKFVVLAVSFIVKKKVSPNNRRRRPEKEGRDAKKRRKKARIHYELLPCDA